MDVDAFWDSSSKLRQYIMFWAVRANQYIMGRYKGGSGLWCQ
jgi:hypothetical protein